MAQYAAAGILLDAVVRMSADGDIIHTREFHLDAATCQYRMESVLEHGVALTYPFKIAVPFEELTKAMQRSLREQYPGCAVAHPHRGTVEPLSAYARRSP